MRFSQASIKNQFKDGASVQDLAQALMDGTVGVENVPPIRLVRRDGKLFSLDNRRLEAFRRAGLAVRCRMASPQEVADESWKFTRCKILKAPAFNMGMKNLQPRSGWIASQMRFCDSLQ